MLASTPAGVEFNSKESCKFIPKTESTVQLQHSQLRSEYSMVPTVVGASECLQDDLASALIQRQMKPSQERTQRFYQRRLRKIKRFRKRLQRCVASSV
jgi:hypothetical protein